MILKQKVRFTQGLFTSLTLLNFLKCVLFYRDLQRMWQLFKAFFQLLFSILGFLNWFRPSILVRTYEFKNQKFFILYNFFRLQDMKNNLQSLKENRNIFDNNLSINKHKTLCHIPTSLYICWLNIIFQSKKFLREFFRTVNIFVALNFRFLKLKIERGKRKIPPSSLNCQQWKIFSKLATKAFQIEPHNFFHQKNQIIFIRKKSSEKFFLLMVITWFYFLANYWIQLNFIYSLRFNYIIKCS